MAERTRRKSSILKLPKARTPLQDVNTLDINPSPDEETTSHTTNLRRRVSFHSKNFVKEFCSEADIASVHHAPEYEQDWSASLETTGSVASGSSNTLSCTTISKNNSSVQIKTQTSAYSSVITQNDYDPFDELMMECLDKKPKPTAPLIGKAVYDFTDIKLPFASDEDNTSSQVVQKVTQESKPPKVLKAQSVLENNKTTEGGKIQCSSESHPSSHVLNIEHTSEKVCLQVQKGPHITEIRETSERASTKVCLQVPNDLRTEDIRETFERHNSGISSKGGNSDDSQNKMRSADIKIVAENTDSELSLSIIHGGAIQTPTVVDSVFSPAFDVHDKTTFDDSGMDFTKPIPGIIVCGIQICPVDENTSKDNCEGAGLNQESGTEECKDVDSAEGSDNAMPAAETWVQNESMDSIRPIPEAVSFGFEEKQPAGNESSQKLPVFIQCGSDTNIPKVMGQALDNTSFQQGQAFVDDMKRVEAIHANRTMAMSCSMEFTQALPANIEVGLNNCHNDKNDMENQQDSFALSKTLRMCTTMDFTQALPCNIQVDVDDQQPATICAERDIEKNLRDCAQATCTSMDLITPLPGVIQVACENNHKEDESVLEQENVICNRTQHMHMSMELTRPVPNNIQVGFEERHGEDAGEHENAKSNCTQIMCSSMEFTKPLPGNIIAAINYTSVNEKDSMILHEGEGRMDTSEVEVPKSKDELEKVAGEEKTEYFMCANETRSMCTSMEFTEVVPSNIEVNFVRALDPIKSFNKECDVIPEYQNVSMEKQNVLSAETDATVEICKGTSKAASSVNSSIDESTRTVSAQDSHILETATSGEQVKKDHTSKNTDETVKEKARDSAHSNLPSTLPEEDRMLLRKLSLISDPFLSRPQLIVSPPTQDSMKAVLTPNCSQENCVKSKLPSTFGQDADVSVRNVSHSQNETINVSKCANTNTLLQEEILWKKSCTPDPFKSKSCLVFSPQSNAKMNGEEKVCSAVTVSNTEILNQGNDKNANEFAENVGQEVSKTVIDDTQPLKCPLSSLNMCATPDPFKSMPRLQLSPCKDLDFNSPVSANSLVAVANQYPNYSKHCTLLDEPPPFSDVPSINSNISVSFNESGAQMLHTTIRNAEITLRQIQSPNFPDLHSVSVERHAPEEMDCDPVPSSPAEQTNFRLLAPKEANSFQHLNTSLSCSLKNEIAEQSAELPAVCNLSDKDCRLSLKRLRDLSPSDKNAEQDISGDSSYSKRLCKSSQGAVNVEPLKSPIIASLNLSNDQSSNNSSVVSVNKDVDWFIFNHPLIQPRIWEAVKEDNDLWSIKFNSTCLELKTYLKPPTTPDGTVESSNGYFISHVTESTIPIIRWAMSMLMDQLRTNEWKSLLSCSPNFINTMLKLRKIVSLFRTFIVDTIVLELAEALTITQNSLSFNVTSLKCHLWFRVNIKLNFWEKYTPEHVSVENIVGIIREAEVKNLVTGVKKDVFFLRNYIRDIKDYVKTLEGFCKKKF